jgi:CRISPR-associated protein Cmr2
MKYLLQVNIGPVQSFIASARRTRDLWFGSALLSRLAMEAAIIIKDSGKDNKDSRIAHVDLIFPSPTYIETARKSKEKQEKENKNEAGKDNEDISVPNKIVAEIDVDNATLITELGQTVRETINKELYRIKDIAYGRANKQFFDSKTADAQIADLIEYRWVALPYKDRGYDETRKQLELLMAARKNVQNFRQVTWGLSVAKSSIDGQLECVIFDDRYPRRSDATDKRFEKQAVLYRQFRAGPAERLSGVDLLKRRGDFYEKTADEKNSDKGDSESGFPSTSHIATIPYLERLSKLDSEAASKLEKQWNAYIKTLEDLRKKDGKDTPYIKDFRDQVIERVRGYSPNKENICPHPVFGYYDGSMLFHEHFLDIVTDKKFLDTSVTALQNFFKAVRDELDEKLQPRPYYAILQADGDGMGKVIDHEAERGTERHKQLSQQIDKFAQEARKIVRDHLGATIYAGGDDVLALVPIHKVLDCAADLSDKFKDLLKAFSDASGKQTPTLSVGIAIVHHLELLSEARKVAIRAEKKAKGYQKKKDGQWLKKDALAIIVSKRSGEAYDIAGSWGDLNSFLGQLIGYYQDEIIPKGTAYELRESALRLQAERLDLMPKETDSSEKNKSRDVLLAEAERILQRKLLVGQGKSSKREKSEQALGLLERRLGISGELAKGKGDKEAEITSTIEEFVHELVIAEMLADAERLAGIEKREGQK